MKDCTCPECECTRLREQLRQAKVEILREASEKLHDYGNPWVSDGLRRMADELEKAK